MVWLNLMWLFNNVRVLTLSNISNQFHQYKAKYLNDSFVIPSSDCLKGSIYFTNIIFIYWFIYLFELYFMLTNIQIVHAKI